MKTPTRPGRQGVGVDAEMIPMVDVIFLLLIYFLCASGLQPAEELLPTRLPVSGGMEVDPAESDLDLDLDVARVELEGDADSAEVSLNGRRLPGIEALLADLRRLAGASTELPVVVDAGPDVPLGRVVRVYDGCLAMGFVRVFFAADRPVE